MVKGLLVIFRALWSAWLLELAGAGLVVAGLWLAFGGPAAMVAGGVAVVAKSVELDQRGDTP